MHLTDLYTWGSGGMPPRKSFDFRPTEFVSGAVWGEIARVGRPTANFVFKTFKKLVANTDVAC